MDDRVSRLVEQRVLRRGIIDLLAAPLHGDARVRFLAEVERRLNQDLPAPGRAHMKLYLKAVD